MNPGGTGSSADNSPSELGGHSKWLRRRAFELVRNEELARDLVQETFVAYLKRPPQIDQSLRAWLEAVMRNHFRMWCRSTDRRSRRELATLADGLDVGPEPAIDRRRTALELEAALSGVQEPYRSTLQLRYFEGLQPAQIARRLGIPQSTVRRRNLVGLKLLRDRLLVRFGNSPERLDQALVRAFIPTAAWPGAKALRPRAGTRWFSSLGLAATVTILGVWVGTTTNSAPGRGAAAPSDRISDFTDGLIGMNHDGRDEARRTGNGRYRPGASMAAVPTFSQAWQSGSSIDPTEAEDDARETENRTTVPLFLSCGKLQDRIDTAAPGTTIDVPACVFRESLVIDKPLVLRGQPGTELRGSDVFADWTRDGEVWRSARTIPDFPDRHCAPTRPGDNSNDQICWDFEQVYLDGTRLAPVGASTTPLPGQFAIDAQRHVLIADDPSEREIEVTVRPRWALVRANDVTISGFTFAHALGGSHVAALAFEQTATRGRIHRNRLLHSGGMGLSVAGTETTVTENRILHSGGMALAVHVADNTTVTGNEFAGNGLAHRLDNGWVTGGVGVIASRVVLSRNRIVDNKGIGINCMACRDSVIRLNRIGDNAAAAVINFGARNVVIAENVLWRNGQTFKHPAMFVTQSNELVVKKNTFAFHERGVVVNVQELGELPSGFQACLASHNNSVEENVFLEFGNTAITMTGDPRPIAKLESCPSNRSFSNRAWLSQGDGQTENNGLLALSPVEQEDALRSLLGDDEYRWSGSK